MCIKTFKESLAERPCVHFLPILSNLKTIHFLLLRSKVWRWPILKMGWSCESEIDYYRVSIFVHHNISRFNVSVREFQRVQTSKTLAQFISKLTNIILRQLLWSHQLREWLVIERLNNHLFPMEFYVYPFIILEVLKSFMWWIWIFLTSYLW